jgi:hypothetical protein
MYGRVLTVEGFATWKSVRCVEGCWSCGRVLELWKSIRDVEGC